MRSVDGGPGLDVKAQCRLTRGCKEGLIEENRMAGSVIYIPRAEEMKMERKFELESIGGLNIILIRQRSNPRWRDRGCPAAFGLGLGGMGWWRVG